jgi:hypothetical protein
MEPLHPGLRAALKEVHPGLTDKDIDETEELLSRRMQYDPTRDASIIAELDRRRLAIIREKMPNYQAVSQTFNAQRQAAPKTSTAFEVRHKPGRAK